MKNGIKYWNRMSHIYNKMFDNLDSYQKMYQFIGESLHSEMRVLEVGTGTGMIARKISDKVKSVEATDYSEKMIEKAKNIAHNSNISYSCADVFNLPFEDSSFDVVIVANTLHVIPNPEKALAEIRRVLLPTGILIAPTFMWKSSNIRGRLQKFFMRLSNFPIYSRWDINSFSAFLENNNFNITRTQIIKANFLIACVECKCNT